MIPSCGNGPSESLGCVPSHDPWRGGGTAPCTATAISAALDGESLASYVCSEGYAAGSVADTEAKFILQSEDGTWVKMTTDPCGSASAGLPPVILEDGCEA